MKPSLLHRLAVAGVVATGLVPAPAGAVTRAGYTVIDGPSGQEPSANA